MIITHNGNIIMSDGFILNKVSSTPTPPSFADTKSFQFDGVTDRFIGVGNYSELDGQNKATFSFWIKPPSVISSIQVVSSVRINTSASNKQFQIQLYTSGLIALEKDSGSKYIRGNSSALNLGQWNHVLFCFDTTQGSSANRGRVFINGINETIATSVSGVFSTATGGLYIAENQNGQYDPFEGLLNEVAIWSGSDQRANVSEIYNGGLPNDLNNLPTAPQPTTWQRMGEDVLWNGFDFTMTDVNGGYVNRGIGLNASDPNPTTDVPLFDNKSFTYDGTIDTINIGSTPLDLRFNRLDTFSFSAWVKVDTTQNNVIIANQRAPSTNYRGYYFAVNSSNQIIVILRSNLSDRLIFTSTSTISNSQWYHIAFTYDGTASTSGGNIYIDSILDTLTRVGGLTATMESTDQLYIGSRNSADNFFNGNINDTSIFNTELTQANVSTIFNGGLPNNISALSPISYWRAEQVTFDGTNWTLIDQGSGGNNGTSVSMPLTARTSDVPLFDNKSFTYDGNLDYVNLGDNNNLSFGDGSTDSPFSISSWWYMTDASNFRGFQKFDALLNCEYRLNGTANSLRFAICDASFYNRKEIVFANLSTYENQWINVVATYNANGLDSGMKLYINGTQVSTNTNNDGTYVAMENTSSVLTISKLLTLYSNGKVNDTSLFNSELTQANVTQIYNGGIANDISSLNPLGYWRSEFATWDGSNWTMIDQGSGANNGLTSSMPLTSRTSDVPT